MNVDNRLSWQYSFLVLTIYSFNHCCSDMSFNYFKATIQQFLDNSPKTWDNYIKIFLYRYLKYTDLKLEILQINVLKMYKYSIIFLKMKDKSVKLRSLFQGARPSYESNVTWTSGQIFIFNSQRIYRKYQFYFNINPKLKLNMTFFVLHLQGALTNCKYDKLEIESFKETKGKYKYCGYHSNLNVYPEYNNLILNIKLVWFRPFELNAIFSVTDKNLIFSKIDFPPSEHEKNFIIRHHCYKIGGTYYLISFIIRIAEIYRVQLNIINSTQRNYVIYDGPGYVFDILNTDSKKSTYIASTFQCVLQFFTTYLIQTSRHHINFNIFYPDKNTIHKHIKNDSEMFLHIPLKNCQENWCNIFLKNNLPGSQFNYKVLNMSVYSPDSSGCLFQGLYTAEIWDKGYRVIDQICSGFNASVDFPESGFQTKGPSLVITLFWYKGYSSLISTLSVTITECKTVDIDICTYVINCILETSKCSTYLEQVTRHTMFKLSRGRSEMTRPVLYFSLPHNYCIFLTLTAPFRFLKNLFLFCEIAIVSKLGEDKINYIDGFIGKANVAEVVGQKDCLTSKHLICKRLSNGRNIPKFHVLKYLNRFKVYSGEIFQEINVVFVKMNYRIENRRWVNIMLRGSKEERHRTEYGVSVYTPGRYFSVHLLEPVLEFRYMLGTDWLLNINSDKKLGPKDKSILCYFALHKVVHLDIFPPVVLGK